MTSKCGATLEIADNFGDNFGTIICDYDEPGHPLPHRHEFWRNGTPVVITFECDERYDPCQDCDTPTLKHVYGFDDEEEVRANVGRLQRCKICYAYTCETCTPKHQCSCDGCQNLFSGADLRRPADAGEHSLDYYCPTCIAEGRTGGTGGT